MAKLIEKNSNYAFTIERIKNITFSKLRSVVIDFTKRLPADLNNELYEAIQHGVCQLQSEPELNMYIHALGLMHEAKLQHAFEHLVRSAELQQLDLQVLLEIIEIFNLFFFHSISLFAGQR